MNKILNEIQEHFAANIDGMRELTNETQAGAAYTLRIGVEFGVAIEYDKEKDVYEESASAVISTKTYTLTGELKRFLVLSCCDETFRNEFAELCYHFVEFGNNGENRKLLLEKPLTWWNQWIGLLGDTKSGNRCYDVLAEMIALNTLFAKDNSIEWTASHTGSHDIESSTKCFEVKSTIKKAETTVTISSQHQLYSQHDLDLIFLRLEQSALGVSINDMKIALIKQGYDETLLETQLSKRGYIKGSSIRDLKYTVLEARCYKVDDSFPKIIASSFKNDVYPANIVKILYTIDLEGLAYSKFE